MMFICVPCTSPMLISMRMLLASTFLPFASIWILDLNFVAV